MGFLYINSKGQPWRRHSYSAGNVYDQCPYKYYLQKVEGWKPKQDRASLLFGIALEESIQFYHENNGEGAPEEFQRRWSEHKGKELKFTIAEKDWENLYYVGTEMVQLYKIRQPNLPIPLCGTIFQKEFEKEVFPGDPNYGEILDAGKLDIVSYPLWDHPALPKLRHKSLGAFRPIIIDIKTAAIDFAEQPGMAAFDKQLRRYSWLTGIQDVGLLWFKKTGRTLRKGGSITLLRDVTNDDWLYRRHYLAGEEAVIAKVDGEHVWIVKNDFMIEQMDKETGSRKGKRNKEDEKKLEDWFIENALRVKQTDVTRQRLQFNCGYVSKESADDAGQIAARQIVSIVNSWKTKSWPQTFGIRYPNDDRHDPYFKAFVANDPGYRESYFTQSTDQFMDDLFGEEEDND